MTDQDGAVAKPSNDNDAERPERSVAEQLVEQARADGVDLVGPGGLLSSLTKQVLEVPRDRDGSFEPKTVKKRQRRLDGVDSMVISLTAKGLTSGEVEARFDGGVLD